jgi:hypothetical protein
MDSIKAFCLTLRHVNKFQATDLKTIIENSLNDRSAVTRAHCIGFDDSKG